MEPLTDTESRDTILRALYGTEQSRRVGWAKFYDTDRDRTAQRALGMQRLGLALQIAEMVAARRPAKYKAKRLIDALIDGTLTEHGDRELVEAGRDAADRIVQERWGSWQEAFNDMEGFLPHDDNRTQEAENKRQDLRARRAKRSKASDSRALCDECHRLLGVWQDDGSLQVKCYSSRCNHITELSPPN